MHGVITMLTCKPEFLDFVRQVVRCDDVLQRPTQKLLFPHLLSFDTAARCWQTARVLQSSTSTTVCSGALLAAHKALEAPGGYKQQYTAHSWVLPVFASPGWKEGLDTHQGKPTYAAHSVGWPDQLYGAWLVTSGQPSAAGEA